MDENILSSKFLDLEKFFLAIVTAAGIKNFNGIQCASFVVAIVRIKALNEKAINSNDNRQCESGYKSGFGSNSEPLTQSSAELSS